MNKIYMTKRGHDGKTVVCSEKTRARGKVKSLVLAVAAVGAVFAGQAHAEQTVLNGVATGDNAVALGQDAWATSTSGQAVGHEAVATGTDIDRAKFAELQTQHKAAIDAYKAAQDAVNAAGNNLDANKAAIDSLAKQIADIEAQQSAIADKIAAKNALDAKKDPLNTSLADKQAALDAAKNTLGTITDASGKNLYLNFTDVLNTLNWSVLTSSNDSNANRDTVAAELKQKVETNFAEFADKYTQADYRDIVDGFINRQASYQGSFEGILDSLNRQYISDAYIRVGNTQNVELLLNRVYYELDKDIYTAAGYNDATAAAADSYFDGAYGVASSKPDTKAFGQYITDKGGVDERAYGSYGILSDAVEKDGFQNYLNRNIVSSALSNTDHKPYVVTTAQRNQISALAMKVNLTTADGKNFADVYNSWALTQTTPISSSYFGVKTTSGALLMPTFSDAGLGIVSKLKDYSVNNSNLISSDNISAFNKFYDNLLARRDSIDWNDANAAIDLVDYKKQLDSVIAYNTKIKQALDIYQAIINESAKANADRMSIDRMTNELMTIKSSIVEGVNDRSNWGAGIVVKETAKANQYVAAAMPEAEAIITRINTELKLYNDQDELIVEATTKAKDAQAAYDAAKAEVDKIKAEIAAIDKQIADLGLTGDQAALDDLKAQKEKELADAEARKDGLEADLAAKQKALSDAQDAINNSDMANRGLRNIAHGHDAFASGNDAIAIGTNSTAIRESAIAIGTNSTVTGVKSIALGADNVVGAATAIAIGTANTVLSDKSVAIGNNITIGTGLEGSVVLGDSSSAAAEKPTANITIRGTTYEFAGKNPTSTVSVGSAGAERQITNVAAGQVTATSTDAINGSQLYAVTTALEDLQVAANTSTVSSANGNIVVKPTTSGMNTNYEVKLNSTLAGVDKVGNAGSSISFGDNAISVGGATITNVATPVNATDAANKQYVDDNRVAIESGKGITVTSKDMVGGGTTYTVQLSDDTMAQIAKEESVSAGSNIVVKQDKVNSTGGKNFNVSLASDLTGIKSISNGDTTVKLGDGAVNVGGATITNVATPVNATDAANKQYVDDTRTTITSSDKSITVTKNGYNYDIVSNHTLTVGDGKGNDTVLKNGDRIDIVAGSGAVTTKVEGGNVAVDLSDATKNEIAQINKGLNVATDDGKVTNYKLGDTVAVSGGKNITTSTVSGKTVVDLDDDISVSSVTVEGSTVGMSADGVNAGGKTITNVAPGAISPSSTDAINGSQLHATHNYIDMTAEGIRRHVDDVEDNLEAGIAGTNAAVSLPQVTALGKSMLSVAAGGYKDKSAIAVGYSRLSDNGKMTFKTQVNANSEKEVGYGVGLGFTW